MTLFIIFFVFLAVVMVLTVVIANSRLKKREIDQMKTLVAGKSTSQKKRVFRV